MTSDRMNHDGASGQTARLYRVPPASVPALLVAGVVLGAVGDALLRAPGPPGHEGAYEETDGAGRRGSAAQRPRPKRQVEGCRTGVCPGLNGPRERRDCGGSHGSVRICHQEGRSQQPDRP